MRTEPTIADPAEERVQVGFVESRKRLRGTLHPLRQRLAATAGPGPRSDRFNTCVLPSVSADERHERHGSEILLVERVRPAARHPHESLQVRLSADRNDDSASRRQLVAERVGHPGPTGRHEDRVERCRFGQTERSITVMDLDVVEAQLGEGVPRGVDELAVPLDGMNLTADSRHHGGGVPRP
jgi:hypothetical protein